MSQHLSRYSSSRPHALKLSFGVSSALLNRLCETPYNLYWQQIWTYCFPTSLKWISIDKIGIDKISIDKIDIDNEYLHRR